MVIKIVDEKSIVKRTIPLDWNSTISKFEISNTGHYIEIFTEHFIDGEYSNSTSTIKIPKTYSFHLEY
jgi:hypothetical protein